VKPISHVELSPTLSLSESHDGFWLYDKTRSMNLSMRAKSAQAAFVDALSYYQERLQHVEKEHATLKGKVDAFVGQFCEDDE
jgi:hypothetical protein